MKRSLRPGSSHAQRTSLCKRSATRLLKPLGTFTRAKGARYLLSRRACPSLKLIIHDRELNIKRIQDYDGNILSCRLAVGEAFKESQHIADRTVKVVRLPPERQELNDNPLRFASIAPASSACPQKRFQGAYSSVPGTSLRNVIDAESWIAESTEHGDNRPFKRQRLQDVGPRSSAREVVPPLFHRAGTEDRMHQRLQSTSRRDSSICQVEDSQRASVRKGLLNPPNYGVSCLRSS